MVRKEVSSKPKMGVVSMCDLGTPKGTNIASDQGGYYKPVTGQGKIWLGCGQQLSNKVPTNCRTNKQYDCQGKRVGKKEARIDVATLKRNRTPEEHGGEKQKKLAH